tara:strand:+ start:442 stop:765 length:324 start_codon:yes stop_codon:yes gene_type:complete
MKMDYEKTKQIWEEYSDAEKEGIILRIDELVEQHMVEDFAIRGAEFPVVMAAAGKVGISSDMFYYVMEILTGERYAMGTIYIHYKYEWEQHFGETWEEIYPEDEVVL